MEILVIWSNPGDLTVLLGIVNFISPFKEEKKIQSQYWQIFACSLLYIIFLKSKQPDKPKLSRQMISNFSVMSDIIIFYVSFLIKVISVLLCDVWFD